ncbi:MAG: hypothetical protein ACK5P1_12080 [Sphingobacteriia bacterium]
MPPKFPLRWITEQGASSNIDTAASLDSRTGTQPWQGECKG